MQFFSQSLKQQKAKAEAQKIDQFESTTFEKGKGSKLSVYKRNILVI